jgi:hypothetical protein
VLYSPGSINLAALAIGLACLALVLAQVLHLPQAPMGLWGSG